MFRLFAALPPFALYALAALTAVATWFLTSSFAVAGDPVDSRWYVVGGILAFLFFFSGFQKSLEERQEAAKPRVSSEDVLQKLSPKESGMADKNLDVPPPDRHGPAADTPLGRIRARSEMQSFET